MKFNQLFSTTFISASLVFCNFSYLIKDVQAQACTSLPLVGGEGSEVQKTVSQPSIPGPFGIQIAGNNWNTDWSVPGKKKFRRFIATISSENGGSFNIKMFLKYSDETTSEHYNNSSVQINQGTPVKIEATPRTGDMPYQVNLLIGGSEHIGNSYRASVVGCV